MRNKKLETLFINGELETVSREILDPKNRAKIKKYDEKRKNFIDLKDHKNGFISPNGVFYPCSWASHETLREYLSWILEINFEVKSVNHMDSIKKFESQFVKLSHTDEY